MPWIAGLIVIIASSVALPGPESCKELCSHARMARLIGPEGPGGGVGIAADSDTDVLHYNLDIEIDPSTQWIGGTNTMTVKNLVDGLTTFEFRLRSQFNITDVRVNGTAVGWNRLSTTNVNVNLDRAYNAGEQFDLFVAYNGNPVSRGFGSIEFGTHSGQPLVFTLSETSYAYTWWPNKDDNADKATADMSFTVPSTMSVVSNGVLVETVPVGDSETKYHWRTNYQTATYLYCFSATNYATFDGTFDYDGGSMPLQFFIYPEDNNTNNRNAWLRTEEMLGVFSDRYGLYPFVDEKYGIYEFGFGGGMEHQTMTGQGTFSESVTAHELGHQWWGDMITCRFWNDIWLNEGFATYSEALWYEGKTGGGEAAYHSHMDSRRPSSVNGSVYCYDTSDLNRVFSSDFSYRKPGWVLHMLRHAVGDQTFFDILAAYRAIYQYDSATTEDFIAVAESVYGSDLRWFFDPWVYDVGAPAYRFGWRQHSVNGRNYVEVYATQIQTTSYPTFTMPVDVVTATGGVPTTHVVWNDERAEHLLFETEGAVNTVAFDPDEWILWTSLGTAAFVEGPPKVVSVAPDPSALYRPDQLSEIEVTFHKDVVISPADVSLVGATFGPVAFNLTYDSGTQTATITPTQALPYDDYTLTIADSVVDAAASKALDGEVSGPLPSGEGLPGGDAMFIFRVRPLGSIPPSVRPEGRVKPPGW